MSHYRGAPRSWSGRFAEADTSGLTTAQKLAALSAGKAMADEICSLPEPHKSRLLGRVVEIAKTLGIAVRK
jgi:hypothetical protein